MALLEVKNLRKIYNTRLGGSKVQALEDVNFSVELGEYVAIMGESGSGKTTLLNIMASLDKPTSGHVILAGKCMDEIKQKEICAFRRDNLGFVFQDFNLLDTLSLKDNILLPLVLAGKEYQDMQERLYPLAEKLAIQEILDKYPYEVSGGQKQRAAVARALITRPQIILADEPTGALDSKAANRLLSIFEEVNREGQTILMVTHSIQAASRAGRVLFIKDGSVFNQIYRGGLSNDEMYRKISDTLSVLHTPQYTVSGRGNWYEKGILLPRLACSNIRKNATTYLPYIVVSIFAMFTYFVFDLLILSDVAVSVPKAGYVLLLLQIGFVLLGIIMIPFLFYTNSFLIKRRKQELGLYSILGLEKKHIGIMMLWETLLIYGMVTAGAVLLGLLFSKLVFLLLINLAGLPVTASFDFNPAAFVNLLRFYGIVSLFNLIVNLFQVGKANPIELMSETRKGEKEPKRIGLWTVIGLLCLGLGYNTALRARLNSMIFTDFFVAVFFVVAGTYCLFTSGSMFLLRMLKRNKKYYYKADNFITISGMLYRMKKNAASLSNICIFGTMVIITVVCTTSLYLGLNALKDYLYPYDVRVEFFENTFSEEEQWVAEVEALASSFDVAVENTLAYDYIRIGMAQEEDRLVTQDRSYSVESWYGVYFLTLDGFNRLEHKNYELAQDEVLLFSTGADYCQDKVIFQGAETYRVKEELMESRLDGKFRNNVFGGTYYIVFADEVQREKTAALFGVDGAEKTFVKTQFRVNREAPRVQEFYRAVEEKAASTPGFVSFLEAAQGLENSEAMYGGLLFIGIFFGVLFLIYLLIIMYYKQITEGYEDRNGFEIMQKVGMSDREVRKTIKKQIMLMFSLPLVGAVLHTCVGLNMVIQLMATISMFRTDIIIVCAVTTCLIFAVVYSISYRMTARSYYRIVKRMG